MPASDPPSILVVGAGALGGVAAHALSGAGQRVTLMTHDPEVARVLQASGLRELRTGLVTWPTVKLSPLPNGELFHTVILATQPTVVGQVASELVGHLEPDGVVVCLQNGLCEELVARQFSPAKVVGAVVAFGATAHGAGLCERTSKGGLVLGAFSPEGESKLGALAELMAAVAPVRRTKNLAGVRWSKLAINCAVSTLGTVSGERLGTLLGKVWVRRLALEIMAEAVAVAAASGVELERLPGAPPLEWLARLGELDTVGKRFGRLARHGITFGIGARYRRLRSSMLRAIERGRPPAVEFLNGELVTRGEALGVPTPTNRAACAVVWSIARGEVAPSLSLLRTLYESTRDGGQPGAREDEPGYGSAIE